MKKDIKINQVKGVQIAAIYEKHPEYHTDDWNIYLINTLDHAIETILIVSEGKDEKVKTSVFRRSLKVLPAKSYAKIELIQPELLQIDNLFSVSFFDANDFMHKNFILRKNSAQPSKIKKLPVINKKGVLAE